MRSKQITEPATTKIWSCKIGECASWVLQDGADGPMRRAVAKAYQRVTGQDAEFVFSGWGAELDEGERAVVDNRDPRFEHTCHDTNQPAYDQPGGRQMSETSDVPVSVGALRISQERARQMREERWSHAHDDEHIYGELAKAAACLACRGTDAEVCDPSGFVEEGNMDSWGLTAKHWRDRVRCLEIAGALIAAELDREIRAASRRSARINQEPTSREGR